MAPKASIKPKVQLLRHLKTIISTAQPFIPISKLKSLKTFFRDDKGVVKFVYDFLLSQLHQDNSRIRFTTFTIIEYLFSRCKYFRDLLIEDLNEIIQLTTGIQSNTISPLIYARKLRLRTIRVLNNWNQLYGTHYPSLSVSAKFLKRKHKDSDSIRQLALSELPMNSEDILNCLVPDKAIQIIQRDLDDTTNDIEELISKCNSCFELLIPKIKDFYFRKVCESENSNFSSTSDYSTIDSSYEEHLEHSIINQSTIFVKRSNELSTQSLNNKAIFDIPHRYSEEQSTLDNYPLNITSPISKNSDDGCEIFNNDYNAIQLYHDKVYNGFEMEFKLDKSIVQIQLSPDNQCIIANLFCFLKLLTIRYLPRMLEWLQTIGRTKKTDLLVSLIICKNKICGIISKAQHIEIYDSKLKSISPLLNYFSEKDKEIVNTEFQHSKNAEFTDPTSFFAQISSKSVSKLDRRITIQDRDVNLPILYHDADFSQRNSSESFHSLPVYEGLHTFWVSESEKGKPSDAAIALLDNRLIKCSKMFRPIENECGFPLANGKLCARRDKYICPFHGRIISRNLEGTLISPGAEVSQNPMEIEKTCNEMGLLSENIPGLKDMFESVKMKNKNKNYPKEKKVSKYVRPKFKNTARSILEKKLLDASTSIKVSHLLNSMMHEKNKSKFIYNFNYALHS